MRATHTVSSGPCHDQWGSLADYTSVENLSTLMIEGRIDKSTRMEQGYDYDYGNHTGLIPERLRKKGVSSSVPLLFTSAFTVNVLFPLVAALPTSFYFMCSVNHANLEQPFRFQVLSVLCNFLQSLCPPCI